MRYCGPHHAGTSVFKKCPRGVVASEAASEPAERPRQQFDKRERAMPEPAEPPRRIRHFYKRDGVVSQEPPAFVKTSHKRGLPLPLVRTKVRKVQAAAGGGDAASPAAMRPRAVLVAGAGVAQKKMQRVTGVPVGSAAARQATMARAIARPIDRPVARPVARPVTTGAAPAQATAQKGMTVAPRLRMVPPPKPVPLRRR